MTRFYPPRISEIVGNRTEMSVPLIEKTLGAEDSVARKKPHLSNKSRMKRLLFTKGDTVQHDSEWDNGFSQMNRGCAGSLPMAKLNTVKHCGDSVMGMFFIELSVGRKLLNINA